MVSLGQTVVLAQGIGLQLQVLVDDRLPLSVAQVISVLVEHLRCAAPIVLADQVENACGLVSLVLPKLLCAPEARVVGDVADAILVRVPRHVHELADGILHGLEVAHVEDPQPVDAMLVGQGQLLPRVLHGCDVEQLRVAWRSHVVHVIVEAPSALVLALLSVGHPPHVAPVVVAEQQRHVIGHLHALVVIVEHLLVESPHLWRLAGFLASLLGDDFALVADDLGHELGVGLIAHGLVTVAAHADGHDLFRALHALDALTEELLQVVLVLLVVPGAPSLSVAGIFLVVACHGLMV